MKIAVLMRTLSVDGGTYRQALQFCRELQKRGHEVSVYSFRRPDDPNMIRLAAGLNLVSLDAPAPAVPSWCRGPLAPLGTFLYLKKENALAKRLANAIAPDSDIINSQDLTAHKTAHYFKKYRRNIPAVWSLNDLNLARWSLFHDPALAPPKHSLFKKLIDRLRDWYETTAFVKSQDAIVVLNSGTRDAVKKELGRDACIIRSGLDLAAFPYASRKAIAGPRINLLSVGLFFIHRRFEDIIRAVKILCDQRYNPYLTIIGNYTHKDTARAYYERLRALVRELGLEGRVVFCGEVPDEEIKKAYREGDIFVFASHRQTWGLAVFEAQACGTPVILSQSTGASEVLTHGENVFLVEPLKPEAIAAAVRELCENPMLYQKLSVSGRRFVETNISWQRYTDEMLSLFRGLLQKYHRL